MKREYRCLSLQERHLIECLYNNKHSIRDIAKELKRSPNTISQEIKRNKVKGIYTAEKANHKAYYRRYICKRSCLKVPANKEVFDFVVETLRLKWSPERISGYLKEDKKIICSKKAIYKYIKVYNLSQYLMHKGKKQNKSYYQYSQFLQGERKYIEERVLTTEIGHYELDFIVSSKSTYCLLVCVDKLTKYTKILKLENRKHSTIKSAFRELFDNSKVITITTDNDIAFSNWKQLEKQLNTKIYFTHPYHSWEKGLVENTNKWIRQYIPKKQNILEVTEKQIQDSLYYLNDIPRKIINFQKPSVLYYTQLS